MGKNIEIIAKRYANALLETGHEFNCVEEIEKDVHFIDDTFFKFKDLKEALISPVVDLKDKKNIAEAIFKDEINNYSLNFLSLLLDKNRAFLIAEIAKIFDKQLNREKNIATAVVASAFELNIVQQERLKTKLERLFKKKIELRTELDSSLIGGITVKIGDKLIDDSIRTKLNALKRY